MEFISLAVTQPVVDYVQQIGKGGRQIAVQSASPALQAKINVTNRNECLLLLIGGEFELRNGDPGAIWPKHQAQGCQSDNFDDMYDLLSRRPGHPVTFACEERPLR
jgi:hypothetical protein